MLPPRSARLAPLALSLLLAVGAAAPEAPPPPESAFLLDAPGLSVLGPEALEEAPAQFPFAIGERLEYDVSWWGIAVGRASLEVARLVEWRGNRLAHVVATARTNDFFSLLYPVNDRSESWIDIDRMGHCAPPRSPAMRKKRPGRRSSSIGRPISSTWSRRNAMSAG